MITYLLLRDNKQTGPYTLEQLVVKGLKPYDLVWVEGKSAAWRYPSEITELKPYAPAVEEQPYDRFYKKPLQEDVEEMPTKEQNYAQQKIAIPSTPVTEKQGVALPVKPKKVYVTLPATATRTAVAAAATYEAEKPAPVPEKKSGSLYT